MGTSLFEAIRLLNCLEATVLANHWIWLEVKAWLALVPWLLLAFLALLALITGFGRRCVWLCELLTHQATITSCTLSSFNYLALATVLAVLPDPLTDGVSLHLIGAVFETNGTGIGDSGPPFPDLELADASPSPPASPPPASLPALLQDNNRVRTALFYAAAAAIPILYVYLAACLASMGPCVRCVAWRSCQLFFVAHAVLAFVEGVVPVGALLLCLLLWIALLLFFSLKFFWTGLLHSLFGVPLVKQDTAMNRAKRRCPVKYNRKPLFVMVVPIYSEDLTKTIEKTLSEMDKVRTRYEAAGGRAVILVCDDGLNAKIKDVSDTEELRERRRALFRRFRAIWAARPAHGTTWDEEANVLQRIRAGLFKKASNLNGGLTLVRELITRVNANNAEGDPPTVREHLHAVQQKPMFTGYEVGATDEALAPLEGGGEDELKHSIVVLCDADTRTPDEEEVLDEDWEIMRNEDGTIRMQPCDALSHLAREFEAAERERKPIAYAQIRMSCFHDGPSNYFTQHNRVWTDGLFTEAILLMCAGGAAPPIVGHNLALSFNAMSVIADASPPAKFGGGQFFSESHTGEDLILMIQWLARGYKGVYISYMHGWQEGGSEDVHTEFTIWKKHLNSTLEIFITPIFGRKDEEHPNAFMPHADGTLGWVLSGMIEKGPVAPPIIEFLRVLHSSNAPWHSKLGTIAYMGTHFAIAGALPMCFLLPLWLHWTPSRKLLLSPMVIQEYLIFIFVVSGTIFQQVTKRCHLVKTEAGRKLVRQHSVLVGKLQEFIFFSGLPAHLLPVLLKYLLGYKNNFGASHAASDNDDGTATLAERLGKLKHTYSEPLITMVAGLTVYGIFKHYGLLIGARAEGPVLLTLIMPIFGMTLLDANLMACFLKWSGCGRLERASASGESVPPNVAEDTPHAVIEDGRRHAAANIREDGGIIGVVAHTHNEVTHTHTLNESGGDDDNAAATREDGGISDTVAHAHMEVSHAFNEAGGDDDNAAAIREDGGSHTLNESGGDDNDGGLSDAVAHTHMEVSHALNEGGDDNASTIREDGGISDTVAHTHIEVSHALNEAGGGDDNASTIREDVGISDVEVSSHAGIESGRHHHEDDAEHLRI